MIKLVVSDIDGTLVPDGSGEITPEIFDVILALKERGIAFAAASGRQYASMRRLFAPVADDIIFIAENGTNVMCRGRKLAEDYLDEAPARELVLCSREIPGAEVMLSRPEKSYLETKDEGIRKLMLEGYHFDLEFVDDLLPYCSSTNKMAIYRAEGVEEIAPFLLERFGDRMNVAVSGEIWVDFISKNADKGKALAELQQMMHISREETMAFGDNCNDVGLLSRAAEDYAVANANPDLLSAAGHIAPSREENGVIRTIREKLLNK